jgi:hypothetical protein
VVLLHSCQSTVGAGIALKSAAAAGTQDAKQATRTAATAAEMLLPPTAGSLTNAITSLPEPH